MKPYIAILGILALSACSQHKNNVVSAESGEKRIACKQAQKNTKSPFEVEECTNTAQHEAQKDREKEELAERKLHETRKIGHKLDRNH